jgi:hypothetical protein
MRYAGYEISLSLVVVIHLGQVFKTTLLGEYSPGYPPYYKNSERREDIVFKERGGAWVPRNPVLNTCPIYPTLLQCLLLQ